MVIVIIYLCPDPNARKQGNFLPVAERIVKIGGNGYILFVDMRTGVGAVRRDVTYVHFPLETDIETGAGHVHANFRQDGPALSYTFCMRKFSFERHLYSGSDFIFEYAHIIVCPGRNSPGPC